MRKLGKKYVEASSKIEKGKLYDVAEAVSLAKQTSTTKFDSSVEVAMHLNIDTKKSDQQLRGSIVLPHGTGKTKKILVLAKGAAAEAAKNAGADFVGEQELIDKIANENWFDYDVIVATPDMMPQLGRLGKVLGPKGLMPNPKTGTVNPDIAKAIKDIKAGKVEYRADKEGNINVSIGRASFSADKLYENFMTIYNIVLKAKPSTVKGTYMKNLTMTTTMGPSIKVNVNAE